MVSKDVSNCLRCASIGHHCCRNIRHTYRHFQFWTFPLLDTSVFSITLGTRSHARNSTAARVDFTFHITQLSLVLVLLSLAIVPSTASITLKNNVFPTAGPRILSADSNSYGPFVSNWNVEAMRSGDGDGPDVAGKDEFVFVMGRLYFRSTYAYTPGIILSVWNRISRLGWLGTIEPSKSFSHYLFSKLAAPLDFHIPSIQQCPSSDYPRGFCPPYLNLVRRTIPAAWSAWSAVEIDSRDREPNPVRSQFPEERKCGCGE